VVQACSHILQWWRDHRLEFPTVGDLERNTFCIMATSTANEQVFSVNDHGVRSRRVNSKSSSVNDTLFQECSEKEVVKVDYSIRFHNFLLYIVF